MSSCVAACKLTALIAKKKRQMDCSMMIVLNAAQRELQHVGTGDKGAQAQARYADARAYWQRKVMCEDRRSTSCAGALGRAARS
jgi:hypothetical protein